jgi:zinc protease
VQRRELPNGLAVVVKEDHRIPTVTAMVAYRVGSVNETAGLTGVSHFFEHMVFKGTSKYGRGDIDLVTYRCGGENNAFTTHDMTGYWFHVGARHLDEVLDILADTMGNCTIDPREFEAERNTVLQEMNLWLDGPWGRLEQDLEKTVFLEGGYRHPVLGWREDVEKLTRERMVEYYRTYYTPNNASLIVAGDVEAGDVFRRVESRFSPIPRGKEAVPPRAAGPPQAGERSVEVRTGKSADRLILAFRAEPAGTETDIVLDVVSTILGEGRGSRLPVRLVDKSDLAGEGNVEVSNYSRKHEGLFTVRVELAIDASPAEAREVIVEELEALKIHPVGERELRRAKNILRARFAFDIESQNDLVSKVGYFEALGLPAYVREYMDRVEAVTPEQIRDCARRIFTAENRTVATGLARAKKRAGREGARSPRPGPRRAAPRAPQGAAPPSLGDVREVRLENGMWVLVKPWREVPVLAVQAFVDAGPIHEPEGKAGLAELTGGLLDEGIDDGNGRRMSFGELAAAIEFVGGTLETGPTGAAAKVLSEHAPLALDLVRDVLRYPCFPPSRVETLKEDTLAEIESLEDDPRRVAHRLFNEEAYRGHPLHRPSIGTGETVGKITRDDVVAHHRRFFRPENVILSVSGDIDPARAVEEVRARFGSWRGDGPWTPPAYPAASRQKEPRRSAKPYDSRQVRLHLGHVSVDRAHPDYFALRVAETIFCDTPGFTNRLARRIRDVEGLSYDVGGSITAGAGKTAGAFQVSLGVEAADRDRAMAILDEELRGFLEKGPTVREVEDARRYLLASFVDLWETAEGTAAYLIAVRRYGLGNDYPARFFEAVGRISAGDVLAAARRHLDPKNLTVVTVGPEGQGGNLKEKGNER